jgi:hypothetical protein
MSSDEMIRMWKDPERRSGAFTAHHPAGEIALDEVGGDWTTTLVSITTTAFPTNVPTMWECCATQA